MQEFICPICGKIHMIIPYKCECGYEEIQRPLRDYSDYNKILFSIYKFSKGIFNKKIEWNQSNYDLINYSDNRIGIYEIYDDRAIAYVDLQINDKIIEATNGILALNHNVKSLIINADNLDSEMLDESNVRMLFIGNRVKSILSFTNASLKYLEVDKNNSYFTSQNNVLFDKNMTRLIFYCNLKPDEEYTIPETVKVVSARAFTRCSQKNDLLKVIHCSKNVKFEDPGCTPSPYEFIKIIRDK